MAKRSFPVRVGEKLEKQIKDLMEKNENITQREATDIIAGEFEKRKFELNGKRIKFKEIKF